MVDYSKWDKLEISSDEEEEESTGPSVFRVGEGESVTLPGRNVTINGPKKEEPKAKATPTVPAVEASASGIAGAFWAKATRNGLRTEEYAWSQTPSEVVLRLFVPATATSKQVKLSVDADSGNFRAHLADKLLLDKILYSEIQQLDEDIGVDWELIDCPDDEQRLLTCTLTKKPSTIGSTLWWRSAFKGDPQVDPTKLADRSAKDIERAQKFLENFNEATRMFKEKMASRPDNRVEIDVDMSEES